MSLASLDDDLLQCSLSFLGLRSLLPVSLVSRRLRLSVKLALERKESSLTDHRELLFIKHANMFFYGVRGTPGSNNVMHCKELVLPTSIAMARANAPSFVIYYLFDFPSINRVHIQLSVNDLHLLSHVLKSRRETSSDMMDNDCSSPRCSSPCLPRIDIVVEDRSNQGNSLIRQSMFGTPNPFHFDYWLRLLELVNEHDKDVRSVTLRLFSSKKLQAFLAVLSSATGSSYKSIAKEKFVLEDVFEFQGCKEPESFWLSAIENVSSLSSVILSCASNCGTLSTTRVPRFLPASNIRLMLMDNVSACFGMTGESYLFSIPVFLFRATCPVQRKLVEFLRTTMSISSSILSIHSTAMQDDAIPRVASKVYQGHRTMTHVRNVDELWRCPPNSLICSSVRKSDLESMSAGKALGAQDRLAELARKGCRLLLLEYSLETRCETPEQLGTFVANACSGFARSGLLNECGFYLLIRSNWSGQLLVDEAKKRDFTTFLCLAAEQRMATRSGVLCRVANVRYDAKIDYCSYLFFVDVVALSSSTM